MISKFIVVEIQVYEDGTAGTLIDTFNERPAAEQKYHSVLAAAAVSSVAQHSAVMLDGYGSLIKNECYIHETEETAE